MKLYEKYRPNDFSELVGDYSFLEGLISKKKSNAFIFHGNTAGVGKTSSARILAKMIGAQEFETIEINCGADTSIDNIRIILNKVTAQPLGKAWVVILDEAHALSKSAQEAIKVPIENATDNVYFILTTTAMNKILEPIRTRCTKVNFKPLNTEDLDALIDRVCEAEGLSIDGDVLDTLVDSAGGSAREALTLLDAVSEMNAKSAMKYLKESVLDDDAPQMIDLVRLVYQSGSWSKVANLLYDMQDANPEGIRIMLLNYGRSMLLKNQGNGAIMKYFTKPTYDNGFSDLVLMCYEACKYKGG